MDQKAFITIFLSLTFIAVVGGVVVKVKDNQKQAMASPSPSAQLFPQASASPQLQLPNQPQQSQAKPQDPNKSQLNFQSTPILNSKQVAQIQQQAEGGQQIDQVQRTYSKFPGVFATQDLQNKAAVIQTDKGNIFIAIYPDSPKAASNFLYLSLNRFYDGLTFHRVVPGFVIQGGDPLGNGSGGPGYLFEDEPVNRQYTKGTVAMANAGPNSNGSQFFILLDDHPELPAKYTIFGQVVQGQDVVEKIVVGDVIKKITIAPLQ